MEENNEIDLLLKIGRVSPPTSLRAKVESRISNKEKQVVPMQTVLGIAASVAVLLVLNVWVLTHSSSTAKTGSSIGTSIANDMNISVSNQLYHD